MSGTADPAAQRAVEAAKAKAREARDALEEQRQIVAEIEQRLVDGVRSRRAAEAEVDAERAQARFDGALSQLRSLPETLATMREARQSEATALRVVATARGRAAEPSIPEEVDRLVIDLGDTTGRPQQLSLDEIFVRLVRRNLG